jgi:hypothetical protein
MAFGDCRDVKSPLRQWSLMILGIAIETAKSTIGLLAASEPSTIRDRVATIRANILIPQFQQILSFRYVHLGVSRSAVAQDFNVQLPISVYNRSSRSAMLGLSQFYRPRP